MGFIIFTSSGIFNSVAWGLKTGNMLYIVYIGSGGRCHNAEIDEFAHSVIEDPVGNEAYV